ncbi:type II secretion system protein GspM [Ningiella sp. W23]|uniref:type II secretion system protein GspM n=1 Tax=Ningiella sp. W23 TaxID=3023715 RepID=UPI0037576C6E
MQALKQWFSQLTDRERILVLAAGGVSAVVIFYFAIWSPLNTGIEKQRAALKNEQQLLTWVNEQSARVQLLKGSAQNNRFNGSLTQLVNQTTRAANISVSRLQPQDEELNVWIDSVSFNALMSWLEDLEKRGVSIVQSDFSETDEDGLVQVRRLRLAKQ